MINKRSLWVATEDQAAAAGRPWLFINQFPTAQDTTGRISAYPNRRLMDRFHIPAAATDRFEQRGDFEFRKHDDTSIYIHC